MTQKEIKDAFRESARTLSPARRGSWIFDSTKEHVTPRGGPCPAWRYLYHIQLIDVLTDGGCSARFGGWYGLDSAAYGAQQIISGAVCLKHRAPIPVKLGKDCPYCANGKTI